MYKLLAVMLALASVMASTGPCFFTFNEMSNGRSYVLRGDCNIAVDEGTFTFTSTVDSRVSLDNQPWFIQPSAGGAQQHPRSTQRFELQSGS